MLKLDKKISGSYDASTVTEMEYILTDFLLAGFGWLFLVLRYRNKGRIAQVLKANYNGSYSNVGLVFFLNMVAFSIALLSCGLLIALVISLL